MDGIGDSLRAAEYWEGWKGIVAKSSVVPRRPLRLRDRDEMRDEVSLMTKSRRRRDGPTTWNQYTSINMVCGDINIYPAY